MATATPVAYSDAIQVPVSVYFHDPGEQCNPSGSSLPPSQTKGIMQHDLSSSRTATAQTDPSVFTLLFRPLWHAGRAFAFPCDPQGQVDLDAMSERARNNYFYARAMMGRELTYPSVHREDPALLMPA